MIARIALCLLVCTFYRANAADVDIITEPRPGEEYVLVSSGQQTPLRNFETSHKIPEKHPHHRIIKQDDNNEKITKKLHSGKGKHPTEGIVAIEEDKKGVFKKGQKGKVAESIEIDVPVSKLEDIKIKEDIKVKDVDTNPKMEVALEAMSESGKLSNKGSTTTQKPILTTADPSTTKAYDYIPINFDTIDDINSGLLSSNAKLETAGSEQKQHSRIQIKKGPNGQDYEYEYIYYYYDEEDGKKGDKAKASSTTTAPVHNSHDGPQKVETENQIAKESKAKSKYSTIDRSGATTVATPEVQNEVLPTASRSRQRGRTVAPAPVEEEVEEDRLPSSTRFPPRGRNLAASSSTTYVPEVSSETAKHRGRPQIDNVADESIGQTRSRTRAHIRRPSSELVDLDSFKTHSGDIPTQYKELPTRYSSESKTTTETPEVATTLKEPSRSKDSAREGHRLLGAIRFQEILDDSKLPPDYKQTTAYVEDTTEYTTMTAMEKVALDLYAYLAGENLNNEINPVDFDGTTTMDDEAWTTEALSTTEEATTTTTTTSTTTTTTTTPAPTTTTSAAPSGRPSRFKTRPGTRGRASATSSTSTAATEPPQETSTRVRGRFGKPGGVRKTTAAVAAVEASTAASAAAEKATTQAKFGRRGLFSGRTRPSSTTPAPQDGSSTAPDETPAPRPRLRPGLRRTSTSTSAAPAEDNTAASSGTVSETAETTLAPSKTIGRGRPGLRPVASSLRPGARINLRANPRLRPGQASVAPTESASEGPGETSAPESPATDAEAEGSSATPAPEQPRGGIKLRNRLQVAPSPKPRVTVTAPPRRPNPLLKRKLAATEATTEAAKKSSIETTEESTSAEKSETETEPVPVETTPAPPLRGLDALFARRRAAGGIGTRPARPARGASYSKYF